MISPKIVIILQALYSIQRLCNHLMGVFDVSHALFFMSLRWLQKHYHGKITGKIGQRKSQPPYFQAIGILSCWGTRTRTKNDRTRICSVTITPYPNHFAINLLLFAAAKVAVFCEQAKEKHFFL